MTARVIILAGPSGCGKSTLARRSGLPVLELDGFYRDGDAPDMPGHPELGMIDWDHPDSWDAEEAMAVIRSLCREGRAEVPVYSISEDRRTGSTVLELGRHDRFVAEGIFAVELIPQCRAEGLLADAIVLRRAPWKNFLRRFGRDLREGRKSPVSLWRRGGVLFRAEPQIMAGLVGSGCRPLSAHEVEAALSRAAARDHAR